MEGCSKRFFLSGMVRKSEYWMRTTYGFWKQSGKEELVDGSLSKLASFQSGYKTSRRKSEKRLQYSIFAGSTLLGR